jgi:hypothetical protein
MDEVNDKSRDEGAIVENMTQGDSLRILQNFHSEIIYARALADVCL